MVDGETFHLLPPAISVSIADLLSYAFPIDSLTVVAVGRVIWYFKLPMRNVLMELLRFRVTDLTQLGQQPRRNNRSKL